jgi:murein DD-endopeptidase MepM/ murein hydrolase activator NlpD
MATLYAHQSRMAVSAGQTVVRGEVIGYVGCSGSCTGPHLHFEVRLDGVPVDPLQYLG